MNSDDYVVQTMAQCGRGAYAAALSAAEQFDADAAIRIISRLMHRETTSALVPTARAKTIGLLDRAITWPTRNESPDAEMAWSRRSCPLAGRSWRARLFALRSPSA